VKSALKLSFTMMLRRVARTRLILRRTRWLLFYGGVAISSYLLAVASGPAWTSTGSCVLESSPYPPRAYMRFLILNPPALAVSNLVDPQIPLDEAAVQVLCFAVSAVWWFTLAVLARRRHARPHITVAV